METPIIATITITHHSDDAWTIDLHTHGPDGAELFATVGTSEDDADADDPADWVTYWAAAVGYRAEIDGTDVTLTPDPPARWTLEGRDVEGRYELITTERYSGEPVSAFGLAQQTLAGEPDELYRLTTYSADYKLMDRVEVEVHGGKVHTAD